MSSGQTTVGNLAVELGLSDEQFRQSLAHAQVMAEAAAKKMQNTVNQGTRAAASAGSPKVPGGGSAQGLLNLSRAIDDVQYGFRGVINNIEGIVTGFGGSAGVAGAATIAGVAMMALLPKIANVVAAADPLKDLAGSLKSIQDSGIGNTFWQFADAAKATDAAFKASLATLKEMKVQSEQVIFAAGGPGMGAAPVAQTTGSTRGEIFAQQMRTYGLAEQAAQNAFRATQGQSRFVAGALAGNVLTESQEDQKKLNQEIFKAAVEKFGGGQQLRDAIRVKNPGDQSLFGGFMEGDDKATKEVVSRLRLESEQSKVIANDFERRTGAAAELASIEEKRKQTAKETAEFIAEQQRWIERGIRQDEQAEAKKQQRIMNRQFSEYEQAVNRQDPLFRQRDSLLNQMNRSEILGTADVFGANLNAGMKSEELKQLEEINRGIQELKPMTGLG
jgi:hypothetical protein